MKKNQFITVLLALIFYTTSWSQTSYGNLNEGNAGDNGGSSNSFFGYQAGLNNVDQQNTFIGYQSGLSHTYGHSNTFVGTSSGKNNDASFNTFIGQASGVYNTTGSANTFIGEDSGFNNTTGGVNTFIGRYSGLYNETGGFNTYIGEGSGMQNTTGSNNTFLGRRSGQNNQGSGNVFIGNLAGQNETDSNRLYIDNSNTTSPLIWGDFENDILNFNGNVEIGTEAVTADLNVKGKVIATKDIRNNRVKLGGNAGYIKLRHVDDVSNFKAAIAPSDLVTSELLLNYNSEFTNGTRIMGNGLLVDGKVGIGDGMNNAEFHDDYQLAVRGSIIAEELRIRTYTNWWPDYVFEDNYKLPTLEQLEAHIKKQKHLPGIPSAEEVAKEGFAVAEMQAKLLEKIEELTLHLINMNKRMNQLEQENQKLKQDLENQN